MLRARPGITLALIQSLDPQAQPPCCIAKRTECSKQPVGICSGHAVSEQQCCPLQTQHMHWLRGCLLHAMHRTTLPCEFPLSPLFLLQNNVTKHARNKYITLPAPACEANGNHVGP